MRCAPASRLSRSSLLLLVRGGSECVPGSRYCFCCSYAFTATEQEALQRARNVPAVLQGPDPLAIEPARPPQQRREPARADLDGLVAEDLTGRDIDRSQRVRALVGVRPEHDHDPRPHPFRPDAGRSADRACWGRCHAPIRSRRTSPTGDERHNKRKSGQPADSLKESQLAAGRDHPPRVGRHRQPNPNSKPRSGSERRACTDSRRSSGTAARRGHEMRYPRVVSNAARLASFG